MQLHWHGDSRQMMVDKCPRCTSTYGSALGARGGTTMSAGCPAGGTAVVGRCGTLAPSKTERVGDLLLCTETLREQVLSVSQQSPRMRRGRGYLPGSRRLCMRRSDHTSSPG